MAPRLYQYVGPPAIKNAAAASSPGSAIQSREELQVWLTAHCTDEDNQESITATFVIDQRGVLKLAPRRSEHVACAGGEPILSAGELEFAPNGHVLEASNQSTGYCPEPQSWEYVAAALDAIGLSHPGEFTRAIIFRRCPKCNETNIVKDNWYVCELCGEALPHDWNYKISQS